jgi:DNA polymerase (family 10)
LLSINTDAHSADQFDVLHFGIATARRGWAQPKHVVNTWGKERLLEWLRSRA